VNEGCKDNPFFDFTNADFKTFSDRCCKYRRRKFYCNGIEIFHKQNYAALVEFILKLRAQNNSLRLHCKIHTFVLKLFSNGEVGSIKKDILCGWLSFGNLFIGRGWIFF